MIDAFFWYKAFYFGSRLRRVLPVLSRMRAIVTLDAATTVSLPEDSATHDAHRRVTLVNLLQSTGFPV
jgi:hypothetical protein